MIQKRYWLVLFVALAVGSVRVLAEDRPKPQEFIPEFLKPVSNVNMYASSSTDDTRSIGVSLDLCVKSRMRVFGSMFHSAIDSGDLFYDSNSSSLGFGSDPLEDLMASFELESWGVKDHLTLFGGLLKMGWNFSNWYFGAGYGERKFKLTYIDVIDRTPFEVEGLRRQLEVVYYGFDTVWLSFRHEEHDFNKILTRLQLPLISAAFTPVSNALSSSLINQAQELEIGYGKASWNVSLIGSISESAIDESNSQTTSVRYYQTWEDSVATTITIGSSEQEVTTSAVEFFEFGLSFSWR